MKKLREEIIVNILLGIVLLANVVMVEIGLKIALGLELFKVSAFVYDLSYLIIAWAIIWIIPRVKLKSLVSLLMMVGYDIFCFILLMKVQNDIFFVLLSNDIGQLIYQILLILVPFIVSTGILYFVYKQICKYEKVNIYTLPIAIVLCFLGLAMNDKIYDIFHKDYEIHKKSNHPGYIDLYRHSLDDYDVIETLGVFRYVETCRDNYHFSLQAHKISDNDKQLAIEFLNKHKFISKENEMTGVFKDKNLVMVLCESLDNSVINEKLTPNIYKISKEGINFSNHYSPLYKYHTSDSEFMSQTGMYPSQNFGSTYKNFSVNEFPYSLGNMLKDKGYVNKAYHAFYGYFYNRDVMLDHLGFDEFYDAKKLELDVQKNALCGIYGFYEDYKLVDDMFKHMDTDKPFYNLMLMLSGHSTYRNNRPDIQEKLAIVNSIDEYKNEVDEVKNYMAAQMLLDDAIGYLIEGLEDRGLLEDTVICLYSDHYPYGLGTKEALDVLVDNSSEYSPHKTMWMLYNPEVKHVNYKHVTSTFDIYPTLANMFGLDISKAYTVGKDVFSDIQDNGVLFADGSLLTNEYYYSFTSDTFYDLKGNVIDNPSDVLYQKTREVIRSAQDVLRANLYE